jgi:hypothetical protein
MNCPNCKSEILREDINVQTDIAKCNHCGNVFRISDTFHINEKFDIHHPPNGAWYRQEQDKTIVGATTRHFIAFIIVPFMVVWSGFSLSGIYGTQIITGHFSPLMSLFGIPFILGSIFFWSIALMAIWGKVEVTFDRQGGKVFTGLGKIGYTKTFEWRDISRINEGYSQYRYPGGHGNKIIMEGQKRLSFGSNLNDSRRYYLMETLKKFHSEISNYH